MKRLLVVFTVAAIVLFGCQKRTDDIEHWRVAARDPIAAVGHGIFFDAERQKFDPLPEQVIDAQRFYLKRLYLAADESRRGAFKKIQAEVEALGPRTQAERILANTALIDWLAEAMQPEDIAHLTSKNTALMSRYVGIDQNREFKDRGAGGVRSTLLERLRALGLLKFLWATTAGGASYVEECRRAGVPIPPDWGTPLWRSAGVLGIDFLGSTPRAEIFVFESDAPRGVCMALPRSRGDTISLLGVICLGTRTSQSCYWDNQRNKTQFPIPLNSVVPLSEFAGGGDLYKGSGGVCTDCHAGENPFIVHPGQPMDLGNAITPAGWNGPLVHPSWPQNDGPNSVLPGIALGGGDRSCLDCHARPPGRRFPEVSTALPGYCGIIVPNAVNRTMPSAGNSTPWAKHINALRAACEQPPSRGVVINGATQSDPTSGRVDSSGDLTTCTLASECPLGFCYWKTLHGPFWQTSPASLPLGDPAHRGSFLRIYAEAGRWKWRAFSDPTGLPPNAPPGGTAECLAYNRIATVPDPTNCFANQFAVSDPTGTLLAQSIDATVIGSTANVLSGFIGNVAQANRERKQPMPDTLRVWENAGRVQLDQNHSDTPATSYPPGLLTGESWTNGCIGWNPVYAARDVFTNSDVQLVPAPQANDVRCFITGITGGWSSTSNNATVQPYAEIYRGSGGELRLRVQPREGVDRVGAFASCISLK